MAPYQDREISDVVAYIISDLLHNSQWISESDKSFAEVYAKIARKDGEEFSMRYKLRLVDGEWKIHDVVVEEWA